MSLIRTPKADKIENSVGIVIVHNPMVGKIAAKDLETGGASHIITIDELKHENRKFAKDGGLEELKKIQAEIARQISAENAVRAGKGLKPFTSVLLFSEFNIGYSGQDIYSAEYLASGLKGMGFNVTLHGLPGGGFTASEQTTQSKLPSEEEKDLGIVPMTGEQARLQFKNAMQQKSLSAVESTAGVAQTQTANSASSAATSSSVTTDKSPSETVKVSSASMLKKKEESRLENANQSLEDPTKKVGKANQQPTGR